MPINPINNLEAGNSVRSKLNQVITAINVGLGANTILSGVGAPNNVLGKDGDFYLNTSNLAFYGPKAAGVWGGFVILEGSDGTNGLDGKTILSGSAVPASGLGTNGDFYIRTSPLEIYGPKTSGAWGSGTSLVGAAGTNGTNGVSGFGIRYTFNSATTSPPNTGEIRFNNTTYSSVTSVFVHETDRLGNNIAGLLATLTAGSSILVLDDDNPAAFAYFTVSAQTDNGTNRTISVSHIASAGTITGNVSLTFAARGDVGTAGTNGVDGVSGFGLRYVFSATTTAPPAAGEIRLNNATISSVTEIFVNETDRNSSSIASVLDQISNGSPIQIIDDSTPASSAFFTLNSQVDNGTHRTLSVTYLAHAGTFSGNVSFTFAARGAQGVAGNNGSVSSASTIILTDQSATPANPSAGNTTLYSRTDNFLYFLNPAGVERRIPYINIEINAQTGTAYTLVLSDQYKTINLSNAAAITLTVPTNAAVAFPVGTQIVLRQGGLGQVTVAGAGGVTVESVNSALRLLTRFSAATLIKMDTNTWWLFGDLTT